MQPASVYHTADVYRNFRLPSWREGAMVEDFGG